MLNLALLVLFCVVNVICDDPPLLVHAIFRHGNRAIDAGAAYPNDPYKDNQYWPYGLGQLTNKGKVKEYSLGIFLRQRYDTLLGDLYTFDIVDARSTELPRTKMSLELVLASLFPPKTLNIWEDGFNWQPIPYNYEKQADDKLMFALANPDFIAAYDSLKQRVDIQAKFAEFRELNDYLTQYSGWNVTDYDGAFNVYNALSTESDNGFVLPDWTKSVFPEMLEQVGSLSYGLKTTTLELKRLTAGPLLQKIVMDTLDKFNGHLDPPDRKMFLYSGHEFNVGTMLTTLGVFDWKVPPYGSCVLFEVYEIGGVPGIKIFYHNYQEEQPKSLTLPGCQEFCPLEKFVTLVQDYFPQP